MTILEVVSNLQKEKQANVPSRFPCRAIMVKNIQQYCELLSELKKISDVHLVQMQELFTSDDVMPKYELLMNADYQDKWLILTGVCEYLRLFSKSEMVDRRFASLWGYQAPASSTGRIIIPLWGCEAQWFDKNLDLTRDTRQEEFYYDCSEAETYDQKMNLLVLPDMFEKHVDKLNLMKGEIKVGLKSWFDYWLNPTPETTDFILITKRANRVCTTNGDISVHVVSDTLSYIRERMNGADILSSNNCSDEMQEMLFGYALKGLSLDDALLIILNVTSFSEIDIAGKWKLSSDSYKRFVCIWYILHPDNSYLCHCLSVSSDVSNLEDLLLVEVFKFNKPEWLNEYRQLIKAMSLTPNSTFFNRLDSVPTYEDRLEYMTGLSRDERIYILRMVGKWMREDKNQVLACDKLKRIYPALYYYLSDKELNVDPEIKQYMSKYKSFKLENTLPDDEDTYFNGIQTDIYDMRYTVLSEYIDSETIVLWIDALGIEWLPLLHWTLSNNRETTVKKVEIGQASLPTETEYNDQWNYMSVPHKKLDRLDKLAHKGVIDEPDYYACVQEQLSFISGLNDTVSELMKSYHRVIVTGDHGTSRLAARFFHTRDGYASPKDATVCSHGRYCKLNQESNVLWNQLREAKTQDGNKYLVFKNYDHFKKSGFAAGADDENAIYGEVHGGATPEEMLVPIIVVDSNHSIPITGTWENDTVKISMKKVNLNIVFNKPVSNLQVNINGIAGDAVRQDEGKQWTITFRGIGHGNYSPHVVADNRIIAMQDVRVMPALGGGEGDLP